MESSSAMEESGRCRNGTHVASVPDGITKQMKFVRSFPLLFYIILLFIVNDARRSNFLLSLDDNIFSLYFFLGFIRSIVFRHVIVQRSTSKHKSTCVR